MKTLYILGAGFSKDAGGLLMKDFLCREQLKSPRGRLNQIYPHLKQFMKQSIKDGLIKDWNIEEFFNLVSEAELLDLKFRVSPNNHWSASRIHKYLLDYIANELFFGMKKKLGNQNRNMPSHYNGFIKRILRKDVTIITFNWDHLTEFLLLTEFGSLNYCLDDVKKVDKSIGNISNKNGIKLLKLHGSVNWLVCSNPNHPIHIYNSWQAQKIGLDHCSKCHYQLYKLIVPPVWYKRGYANRIGELWETAADELCSADRIVIIGYSLPIFDISAKYLLLLSTYLDRKVKVEIVNGPDFDDTCYK
jgi:NAD-dependent SIR2 family protein deacetylase